MMGLVVLQEEEDSSLSLSASEDAERRQLSTKLGSRPSQEQNLQVPAKTQRKWILAE